MQDGTVEIPHSANSHSRKVRLGMAPHMCNAIQENLARHKAAAG